MTTLSSLKNFIKLNKTQQKTITGGFIGAFCGVDPCDAPEEEDRSDEKNL